MRDTDVVTIGYAVSAERDGHWFEQTDGRDYSDTERMVVTLAPGEWLEYEVDAVDDLSRVSVVDVAGASAGVTVSRTDRGFRRLGTAGSNTRADLVALIAGGASSQRACL